MKFALGIKVILLGFQKLEPQYQTM